MMVLMYYRTRIDYKMKLGFRCGNLCIYDISDDAKTNQNL